MSYHEDLAPDETELVGEWLETANRIVGDATEARIAWLISDRLTEIAIGEGGWRILYRDLRDGRLWELSYPLGSMHGGGPRRLRLLARAEARAKYGAASV